MDELKHLLRRIADSVTAAQAHYQIWFALRGQGKALPEYYHDMNDHRYVDFFHAINPGAYKLIFIEIGCLFDTDPRSASVRNLKSKLNEIGRNDLVSKIETELAPYSSLVQNILTIRSKLMAHKDIGADSEQVHKENGIIPNQVGELIQKCAYLINDIYEELFVTHGLLLCSGETTRFEDATFKMLEVLRNGRS